MASKKSIFESPLLSTKIKSANAKLFPEALIGYFLGPTLAMLSNSVLSSYLNKYLTDVLNMTVWAKTFLTLLPILSVILVVAGNILVGRLMENNKTKAGKARPLLLVAVPFMVLAMLVLFVFTPFTNEDSASSQQILAMILIAIGYNLWYAVAYPFYYTSHSALVGLSTRNSKDRSLIATIANATQLAAIGLCSMILPFFLGKLFVYQLDPAVIATYPGAEAVLNEATGAIMYYKNAAGAIIYDGMASYGAWKFFVIALMAISAVGALLEYYFTRERVTEETFDLNIKQEEKKATPIGQQLKICLKDKFWVIMIIFFLMYQLGGMLKNVSQLYYCQSMFADANGNYTIDYGGSLHGTLSIVGAIPTAVGMVIAWPLANKIGKGKAILFGSLVSVAGGVMGLLIPPGTPYSYPLAVVAFVIKALGSAPAMYLSLALLADIMDHQEALHGVRTDGLSMAIYGAIMVGMTGIATGILNVVLGAVEYSNTNVSSELIRGVLPWIFFGGETIGYAVIAAIFVFMGVEKFSKFDHKAIVMDQKAKAAAEGIEYVDPLDKLEPEEKEAALKKEAEAKAKYDARPAEKKAAIEAEDAKVLVEFNELRKALGKPTLDA